jgi:hypothetical protein
MSDNSYHETNYYRNNDNNGYGQYGETDNYGTGQTADNYGTNSYGDTGATNVQHIDEGSRVVYEPPEVQERVHHHEVNMMKPVVQRDVDIEHRHHHTDYDHQHDGHTRYEGDHDCVECKRAREGRRSGSSSSSSSSSSDGEHAVPYNGSTISTTSTHGSDYGSSMPGTTMGSSTGTTMGSSNVYGSSANTAPSHVTSSSNTDGGRSHHQKKSIGQKIKDAFSGRSY